MPEEDDAPQLAPEPSLLHSTPAVAACFHSPWAVKGPPNTTSFACAAKRQGHAYQQFDAPRTLQNREWLSFIQGSEGGPMSGFLTFLVAVWR